MVKNYYCSACRTTLDKLYDECPHCGACDAFIGWFDEVNGYHEAGCGMMPDGSMCGECCRESCKDCFAWAERQGQRRRYMKWNCEECGNLLDLWLDKVEEFRPAKEENYSYERRHLMWHCTECGSDFENYWTYEFGDTSESKIERKMWG